MSLFELKAWVIIVLVTLGYRNIKNLQNVCLSELVADGAHNDGKLEFQFYKFKIFISTHISADSIEWDRSYR